MKKAIVAIWIFIIAFVTVACQAQPSSSESYDKYEDLIEAIEDGNMQLAQEELDKFFDEEVFQPESTLPETGGVIQDEQESGEQTNPEIETEDPLIANMREVAISEWIPSSRSACEELGTITINADGSCVIGGETLQWEVVKAEENSGYIQVLLEQKPYYELNIYKEKDGYHGLWIYKFIEDGTQKEGLGGNIYRASDLEKTVITIDNWEEYFIFETQITISKNAFGEPDDANIYKYIKLNPDMFPKVVDSLCDVAYEYKSLDGFASVSFDLETQEYTAEFHENASDDTCMSKMQLFGSEETEFYGGIVESRWITELPYDESAFWEEYKEMLRIEGVIYSVK